ncbi:MAG: hypothetical protein AB7G10_27985, partial [Reyranellaceae bacterium]
MADLAFEGPEKLYDLLGADCSVEEAKGSIESCSMRNARLALFAVVLAGVGALAWWWSGLRAGDDVRYRTARIEQGPLQAAVSASGTVTPVS